MITRSPIDSSSIASAGFDPQTLVLEIEFYSGAVYRYFQVSAEIYEAFRRAESKGRYFGREIRGKFEFERMNKERR